MAKITFIQHDGEQQTLEVENGLSIMNAAVDNLIPGIDADCGGECNCATCHVYIDDAWMQKIGLEWAYRLSRDPKRLWYRYLYYNPLFVWKVFRELGGR